MSNSLSRSSNWIFPSLQGWLMSLAVIWMITGAAVWATPTLTLSPTTITWNTNTFVDFDLNGISTGAAVNLTIWADIDRDGQVGPNDVQLMQFALKDGVSNSLGSRIVVCDTNGVADGHITGHISYHGHTDLAQLWRAAGMYVWQVSDTNGTPITSAVFTITEPSGNVWIQGSVQVLTNLSPLAGQPLRGSALFLDVFSHMGGYAPSTWTDTNGNFTLHLPSSMTDNVTRVTALKPGYFTSETGPDGVTPMSMHPLSQPLHSGTNTLPGPLFLASPVPDMVAALSGTVMDNTSNSLPGVLLLAQVPNNDRKDLSLAISGADGTFTFPWPQMKGDALLLHSMTAALNMRSLTASALTVGPVTNSISGLQLICPVATTLASGKVRSELNDGMSGIKVSVSSDSHGAETYTFSSNGNFEVCLVGGSNFTGEISTESLQVKYRTCQTSQLSNLTLPDSGTFTGLTFRTSPGYVVSGHIYDDNTNALSAGQTYMQHASGGNNVDQESPNLNGFYQLLVPNGTYSAGTYGFNAQGYSDLNWPSNITVNSANITGIDYYLSKGITISGQVSGGGNPLSNAFVQAGIVTSKPGGGWDWKWAAGSPTDTNGDYTLNVPPGSNYTIQANGPNGSLWLQQYFSNTLVVSEATLISTLSGSPVTNINFNLQQGAQIMGQVLGNGTPLTGAFVQAGNVTFPPGGGWNWQFTGGSSTDTNGNYSITLPPGSNYTMKADGPNGAAWIGKFFSNTVDATQATLVTALANLPVTNINFTLALGVIIDGWVHNATNQPISTSLDFQDWDGTNWVDTARTGTDIGGHYSCIVSAYSNHLVRIFDGRFHEVYFSNKLSTASADLVAASPGITVSNVNFKVYDPSADSDSDGLPDYIEGYVTGTDPFNGTDCLRCTGIQSSYGLVTLTWTSVSGKVYGIEQSANLLNGASWTTAVPQPITATGPVSSLTNSNSFPSASFRVLINY